MKIRPPLSFTLKMPEYALCAFLLVIPNYLNAQGDLQPDVTPTIVLDGVRPQIISTSPSTTNNSSSFAGQGDADVPLIPLQIQQSTPDDYVPHALPVERDRAIDLAPTGNDWLMPLTPVSNRLPRKVNIGESLLNSSILRLTGETVKSQLTLDLPKNAITPSELRFSLRSAVNVLTETALLQVSVNGEDPVDLPLQNISDFNTLIVPTSALTTGQNLIELTLDQPHRIFCGPQASFDVWTEINLAKSGVDIRHDTLRPDPEGFAYAMHAELARSGSMEILIDDTIDTGILREASDALMSSISGAGRIHITSFYEGSSSRLAAVALISSDRSALSYRKGSGGQLFYRLSTKETNYLS